MIGRSASSIQVRQPIFNPIDRGQCHDPVEPHMSTWEFLLLLVTRCTRHCIWFILLIAAATVLIRSRPFNTPSIIALLSLSSSVVGITMFIICFLVGGGSNTAQFNSPQTMDYWSLWLHSFVPMLIGLLGSMVVTLFGLPFRPYSPASQMAGRALAFATAVQGFYSISVLIPDA